MPKRRKRLHQGGGVATLLRQDLTPYISTIKRIDRRIMTVTLQDSKALTPITILTTYAPHKGYTATERKQHRDKVDETIQQIPKSHTPIWRTDANGQLSDRKPGPQYKHIVGPYTNIKETEKGNGQRLYNACKTNNLIPVNTWKRPPLNQQEKYY